MRRAENEMLVLNKDLRIELEVYVEDNIAD